MQSGMIQEDRVRFSMIRYDRARSNETRWLGLSQSESKIKCALIGLGMTKWLGLDQMDRIRITKVRVRLGRMQTPLGHIYK